MLVAGAKLRPFGTVDAFRKLMDASNYAVALMPEAKCIVPEDHPNYIGTYWVPVSSPGTAEIIESAKMYLFARGLCLPITPRTASPRSLSLRK